MPQEILVSVDDLSALLGYIRIILDSGSACVLSARNRVASQCMRPSLARRSHLLRSSTGGPMFEPPTRKAQRIAFEKKLNGNK